MGDSDDQYQQKTDEKVGAHIETRWLGPPSSYRISFDNASEKGWLLSEIGYQRISTESPETTMSWLIPRDV